MQLADNKKVRFSYTILDQFEAGIVLHGHEVKSVRAKRVSLKEAYVSIRTNKQGRLQAYLVNCHIAPYSKAGDLPGYSPTRTRQLILHRSQIEGLFGKLQQKGLTIVPLSVYTSGTKIKVSIGLAKGKQQFDKKETIKRRDIDREVARTMKNKR